ncbi:SanA/YdcF family protein [Antribacter gilvus]|uniref:SanA/YdcF family protein n=1 Tax=Antribacter gilvus TaxID=2304675 RepID=UPI0013DEFF68|nr:ElyC/SanA/YdcF family protein [Antribacter gilvus]
MKIALIVLAVLALAFAVPVAWVQGVGQSRVRASVQGVEKVDAIVVLGAGLREDGTPSTFLRRRVDGAVALYEAGVAQTVILSGDAHTRADGTRYDEPASMRDYAVSQGVPEDVLVLDGEGFNTTATCRRAHDVFGVRSAVVVTQDYHLRRTLYSCVEAGLDAVGLGVSATSVLPLKSAWWHVRELPASWKAAVRPLVGA